MKRILLVLLLFSFSLHAQMETQHGDEKYSYNGLFSGNQIRTSFYNDGMIGQRQDTNPDDIRGEWPINSGHGYINQLVVFVGSEIKDANSELRHIVSEGHGIRPGNPSDAASGDTGSMGEWWTWTPLPGFADESRQKIAMSHWDWSWPSLWPDKIDDSVDPGWPGSWNGYFGKNILNADQESYYVMDDYQNREFAFYPDSTDTDRRGLGLRVTVRGFQWSNVLVEDVLFSLYDVLNMATYSHNKMNFGMLSGPTLGNFVTAGYTDTDDDGGEYNLDEDLGYHLDQDNIGGGGFTPVAYHGLAFFESPGNPYDGIDNDNDGSLGSGALISETMFESRPVFAGDQIVVIDYKTFGRTVTNMPPGGITVTYLGKEYSFAPGQILEEIPHNLIDDNLNGLIDENNGRVFGEGDLSIERFLYVGLKCVDYISGDGLDNPLIDEERDDNIDNDNDWDPLTDDVGLDGVPYTGDAGEGDGVPTSGRGTNLPGETHIDKTDIDESDMIGLTAFNIFTPWTLYPLSDDENLWDGITPGFLNAVGEFGDTDILMGSGYFPLIPDQIERFSLGVLFGIDKEDLFRNKGYAAQAYSENYNFSKAPYIPTVTAVPGDNQVTLFWDEFAESSHDPITGEDFEGYRIYRSTDPGWNDMTPITDMYGSVSYRQPLAQFDLKNGIAGKAGVDVNGIHFFLGEDTGLVHRFVDSTATNGYTYYYAVTSYDRGDDVLGIPPSECSKYISVNQDGTVDMGTNVAIVKPEAPALGFVKADYTAASWFGAAKPSGRIQVEIIDETKVSDRTFQVVFQDSLEELRTGIFPRTKNFSLLDVTNAGMADTLIAKSTQFGLDAQLPDVQGFRIALENKEIAVNGDSSQWNNQDVFGFTFKPFSLRQDIGYAKPSDYRIVFGEPESNMSTQFGNYAAVPVNFAVFNATNGQEIAFFFEERDGENNIFSGFTEITRSDRMVFLEKNDQDSLILTWSFELLRPASGDTISRSPQAGDELLIKTDKPFTADNVFEFKTRGAYTDPQIAKNNIDDIRVVPNPYIITSSWEPDNPYSNGRGPRELHFIHLPPQCTIKIYNIRGQLVQSLEHDGGIWNGTCVWDMLSKDLLDISYGVYIYHVDAGEYGQKTGKFALIK
ncbi:hypothetical protein JW935_04030 [candidate division KSB1 bacterium]|nr:hypothetical protein [candidate division KSB1 bacterium]